MNQIKAMYSTLLGEDFPTRMTIILGDEKLEYEKRQWHVNEELKGLRYGENPDQPAAMYQLVKGELTIGGIKWRSPQNALTSAITDKQMLQAGKHPGKTNLTDVDNGANILQYLTAKPACVILKHNNPCGCAWASKEEGGLFRAMEKAFWSDRIAAFGGALIVNASMGKDAAEFVSQNYFEVVAAPAYEGGVLDILKKRKNLRILELPGLGRLEELTTSAYLDIHSLADGGLIVQKSFQNRILTDADFLPAAASTADGVEVVARFPDKHELEDLRFAWAVESGVTSNSVIFARDGATVAIGTGEQDRVGCVEIAIHKAYTKYLDNLVFHSLGRSLYEAEQRAAEDEAIGEKLMELRQRTRTEKAGLAGSRLVSDGFFPFRDGVDVAIAQGIDAIAQPGGSLRDAEVIMACNEAVPQVAMAYTAQRSFRH